MARSSYKLRKQAATSPPPSPPAPSYPPPSYPPPSPPAPAYPPPAHPPSYPPPQPRYQKYTEEVCKLKEWSSDTELCKPKLSAQCEQQKVTVKKVRKSRPMCRPTKVPKCKTSDAAEEFRICTTEIKVGKQQIFATLYEQEMVKRCDTHYTTECKPSYGYKPNCKTTPVQVC